jgi:serine/threonine protein kinase/Tol biopolymer transport system component
VTDERWARVKALFQAAVERPAAERTAFLAAATTGDDELRREVESLLASDTGDVSFLDRLPRAAKAVLADSRTSPPTAGLNQSHPVLELGHRIGSAWSAQVATQSLVGQTLGSYHVLSKIGEGGMGEVYRARDTKLRRDVALKVMPEAFARDPERLTRFEREAQILASLNHKNIAAIYGLEESNGVHFLVLELVEGETFAERIERHGPLPLEKALVLSRQVAEALEYAHKKAITHRDIKPANLKVTPDGEVKVLDFGLAKIFEGDQARLDLSILPTLGPAPTLDGQIVGTPAYMSPEQVRGQQVDKQADIWAFGCVLYALLTGKQAFPGETIHDTISKVLNEEPDRQALPPSTPATLQTLLRRCLHKDVNRRLHDIADARIEIEEALATPAPAEPTAATVAPARPIWRRLMPWTASSLVLAAAAGLVWIFKPPPVSAPLSVSRLAITLPAGQRFAAMDQPAIAISPDGRKIVYVAIQSGVRERAGPNQEQAGPQQLFLRPLDSQESKPVAGTEGAVAPFFSPDGRWIGFFAGGKLKKVSVNGGPVATLANTPVPGGGNWSSKGILAIQGFRLGGLQQISQGGGTVQPLTSVERTEGTHGWPELLPGGNAVLFAGSATVAGWNNAQIAAQPIGGGERKNLVAGTQPRYALTGHLLYMQSGTLMAAPFEPQRLALTGSAVPAVEGIEQSLVTGAAQYSISSTGTLVYLAGGLTGRKNRMVWVTRNGEEKLLLAAPRNYEFPRVSPDGWRVAVTIADQEAHIWVYDVDRDNFTRLTFGGNVNNVPTWSPDGKRIAFRSNRAGGPGSLFWQAPDGSGGAERLTTSEYTHLPNSFSADGKLLAFQENNPRTGRDIWVLRLSDRKSQPFLRTPFQETSPKFSPDARWVAYCSDESLGRSEVYVQPYPGPGGKRQISTEGGQEPVWNPNGRELFYRSGTKIMAVDVDTRSGFSSGTPRMLFEGTYLPTPVVVPDYDVSPDGQRFLMLKPAETQTSALTQINVVLNWFEELKRRVPAGQ